MTAVPIPLLLAETDVLFCAGVNQALQNQREFALELPALRHQQALLDAFAGRTGSIAMVAEGLIGNLAELAQVAQQQRSSIILLTARQHTFGFPELPSIRGALRYNADARQLMECLRSAAAGERWSAPVAATQRDTTGARVLASLSPRQLQVMGGVSRGAKNVEIAKSLGTSEQVVKNMLGNIYDITGVSDRLELALFVLHHPEIAEAARAVQQKTDPA